MTYQVIQTNSIDTLVKKMNALSDDWEPVGSLTNNNITGLFVMLMSNSTKMTAHKLNEPDFGVSAPKAYTT